MKNNHFKQAYQEVTISKKIVFFFILMFCSTAFYPSDSHYYANRERDDSTYVYLVEDGLRYVNTAAQAIIPLILADKVGFIQAAYVGLGTFVSVHVLKRTLNDVYVGDTRLGERPSRASSSYNVPSGHSAMATSAMAFVVLRYKLWWHLLYLLPISIATMGVRILLKAHTLSAVLSGAILGILVAYCLTSEYPSKVDFKAGFKRLINRCRFKK